MPSQNQIWLGFSVLLNHSRHQNAIFKTMPSVLATILSSLTISYKLTRIESHRWVLHLYRDWRRQLALAPCPVVNSHWVHMPQDRTNCFCYVRICWVGVWRSQRIYSISKLLVSLETMGEKIQKCAQSKDMVGFSTQNLQTYRRNLRIADPRLGVIFVEAAKISPWALIPRVA